MFSAYKGMSTEAKYIIYSSVLPAVAYGMFYTDIAYFLTTVQGLSFNLMGIIVTIMGVSTFATSIPMGIAADKYGKKRILILSNIIASIIIAVFALTTNTALLITAAIFEGVSEAASSASISALLAAKAEDTKRNSVFSMFGFAQSTAFGVGAVAILATSTMAGFSNKESHVLLYVILAALSLASTVIILKVNESKSSKAKATLNELLPRKSKNVLAKYVLTGAVIAVGAGLIVPLMTAWMKAQYGIPDSLSGPILGISSIVIGVATLAAPSLAKKFGVVNAIVITEAVSTLFMFATPFSPNYLIASVVYTSRAFLMNMSSPLAQSMIMGLVPEDERGAASGISSALWRLPNALSSFVGAWLIGMGFLAAPFFFAALLYLISIGLFWYFFRKTKMPEEKVNG
ncbi:MAG: MFS transporter [Candidatus Bathyarchaeia archaeon]